jgi:hypothetical protein
MLKSTLVYLLLLLTILMPAASAEVMADLSTWEISVDYTPPSDAHLSIFFNIKNTGTDPVAGVQFSLAAQGVEYIESELLSFGDDDESNKLQVSTSQEQDQSIITILLPTSIAPGKSVQHLLEFSAKGLLKREGSSYITMIRFEEPKLVLENGDTAPMNVNTGSFRIHTPEGFTYADTDPVPWREIWQGVSGFNAHFIQIFNGGTQITIPITVTFKPSATISRAVELYKNMKEQEVKDTRPREDLDQANHHITAGANYVIFNNPTLASIELDKAEAILTGKSVEEVIAQNIETIDDTGSDTGVNVIYFIGGAFVLLLLIIVFFGKNIISSFLGGNKDE